MSSFDIFGITVPSWAWWVPLTAAVLLGLARWSLILVAYVLHLLKRERGEVFEVKTGRFGLHIRHGVLPPEPGTPATPNENKMLPSPENEAPSSKNEEGKGDTAPIWEPPN